MQRKKNRTRTQGMEHNDLNQLGKNQGSSGLCKGRQDNFK